MKLVDISVKRPVGIIILSIALLILGAVSLNGLALDLLPDIELPVAAVMTSYSGAGPEEVENLVTKPLEGALATLEGLETLQSISVANQSIIIAQFKFGTKIDSTLLDIRDKVDFVRQMLPDDADQPSVLKFDPNSEPIMQLSVSGPLDEAQLTTITEDLIQPRLERVKGVAQVGITGDKVREIQVNVDPIKLQGYGVTLNQIIQSLASENMTASAGNLNRGAQDMQLRIVGEFKHADDIKNINITLPNGQWVKLNEIADVQDTFKDQTSLVLVNGERAISLDVSKASDGNTVSIGKEVENQIQRMQSLLPADVKLDVIFSSAEFIQEAIDGVTRNLIMGGTFAILILYLFLGNYRSTLVIATALPLAVITTFILMYFTEHTLNILTMGGLALGIGMMVDSAIVILENIYSYRERGYSALEAAREGASEIAGAVIASALTTIAVFFPIVFSQGIASEIFSPLALTVSFSLLASVGVALTIIPMLASRWIREKDVKVEKKKYNVLVNLVQVITDKTKEKYGVILKWAIGHRKTVVIITTVAIFASLGLFPLVGAEFIPSFDQGEVMIDVELPTGTKLEETTDVMLELSDYLSSMPEIESVFVSVGGGGMGVHGSGAGENIGLIYTKLIPRAERTLSTDDILQKVIAYGEEMPDADVKASSFQSGGMTGAPLSIEIVGDNLDVLSELADEVKEIIKAQEGTINISDSFGESRPQLQVIVDRDIAATYGLSFAQILQTVRTGFSGDVATRMKVDGEEVDIRVQLPKDRRENINDLRQLTIATPHGAHIPLQDVAKLREEEGQNVINRKNQERGVNVTAELVGGADLGSVSQRIQSEIQHIVLPEGYQISMGGQTEEMNKAFFDLLLALLLAIFLVYTVMAVQFESFLYPFVIMFSMPATIIGIMLGFVLTGRTLSVPAFIGIIMLAGIVVNNAIVLVDYINTVRARGVSRDEAIIEAGLQRIRPILMTTLTTVLAMLPLAIGVGEGSEMQAPLATVIVFGLTFATLITLVLIPVVYIIMDNWTKRITGIFTGERKLFRRKSKVKHVEPATDIKEI